MTKRLTTYQRRTNAVRQERIKSQPPAKPSNPQPDNGWPGGAFEDDSRAVLNMHGPKMGWT